MQFCLDLRKEAGYARIGYVGCVASSRCSRLPTHEPLELTFPNPTSSSLALPPTCRYCWGGAHAVHLAASSHVPKPVDVVVAFHPAPISAKDFKAVGVPFMLSCAGGASASLLLSVSPSKFSLAAGADPLERRLQRTASSTRSSPPSSRRSRRSPSSAARPSRRGTTRTAPCTATGRGPTWPSPR